MGSAKSKPSRRSFTVRSDARKALLKFAAGKARLLRRFRTGAAAHAAVQTVCTTVDVQ
jgi:hypothetical protein